MVVQWIIKHLLSILAGAAVIVIIVIAIYLGVEFTSTSDDYKYLASDSSVAGKKEQFYTEYIEQEEANQEAIASGDSTAGTSLTGGNGGSGSVSTSGSNVKLANGLAQSALAFYDKVDVASASSDYKSVGNGIKIYSSLPWDSDGENVYKLNYDVCKQYVEQVLNTDNIHSSMAKDDNCKTDLIEVDGIDCVDAAGYPILAFCDIRSNGTSIGWTTSTRPRKFCAILKSKSSGEIWYLPLTCKGDAKGHTWPGGLYQTFLSNDTNNTSNTVTFNSDSGHITGSIIGASLDTMSSTDLETIYNGYSNVKYKNVLVASTSPQINLEINSANYSVLNSNYTFEGFIVWKDN